MLAEILSLDPCILCGLLDQNPERSLKPLEVTHNDFPLTINECEFEVVELRQRRIYERQTKYFKGALPKEKRRATCAMH